MYLYYATKDPYLLGVGIDILEAIDSIARTKCGYATVCIYFHVPITVVLLYHQSCQSSRNLWKSGNRLILQEMWAGIIGLWANWMWAKRLASCRLVTGIWNHFINKWLLFVWHFSVVSVKYPVMMMQHISVFGAVHGELGVANCE